MRRAVRQARVIDRNANDWEFWRKENQYCQFVLVEEFLRHLERDEFGIDNG